MAVVIPTTSIRWIENGEPVNKTTLNRPMEDMLTEVNNKITVLTEEIESSSNSSTTASSLTIPRTIALTGAVTGSVSTDFSGTTTIATTSAPNSVELGVSTTGNYVSTVVAGTGITVSGSGSENATVTIGTQLKTINGEALAGTGNIVITGSGTGTGSLTDLGITATATELNYVDGVTSPIQTQLNAKQATLVSGSNIKTINGTTLLGSGDLTISGGTTTEIPWASQTVGGKVKVWVSGTTGYIYTS
jgi:hypothetical protein